MSRIECGGSYVGHTLAPAGVRRIVPARQTRGMKTSIPAAQFRSDDRRRDSESPLGPHLGHLLIDAVKEQHSCLLSHNRAKLEVLHNADDTAVFGIIRAVATFEIRDSFVDTHCTASDEEKASRVGEQVHPHRRTGNMIGNASTRS